jgi:hypothetical protein
VGIPHAFTTEVHATAAVFVKSLKVVEPATPPVPMLYDMGRVAPCDSSVMLQELQPSTVILKRGVELVIYSPET